MLHDELCGQYITFDETVKLKFGSKVTPGIPSVLNSNQYTCISRGRCQKVTCRLFYM